MIRRTGDIGMMGREQDFFNSRLLDIRSHDNLHDIRYV